MASDQNDNIERKLSITKVLFEECPSLERLLQIYLAELSVYSPIKKSSAGEFVYPYLQTYWQNSTRYPYFIRLNENICGFALVREDMDPENGNKIMDLAEFYIAKDFRRLNLGSRIAEMLWDLYPSNWRLSVLKKNETALLFWSEMINRYTKGKFELVNNDHDTSIIYYFDSRLLCT